jgi:hypothetical protein
VILFVNFKLHLTRPSLASPSPALPSLAHQNFFFANSGAVNQKKLNNELSCDHTIPEKIQINLSNNQKKSTNEQFLQAPRNWQKCSALAPIQPNAVN